MALRYADGRPATGRVTDSDMAREPRSLGVIAWFDGNHRGMHPSAPAWGVYPRRLTTAELEQWREGFREGCADRKHLERHGFGPCTCDGSTS